MMRMRTMQPGFSLTELMVYLMIVGILAGGIFGITKFIGRARRSTTESVLRTVNSNIIMYRDDTGMYPNTLDDLAVNPGIKNWKGPYLDNGNPKDGWGEPIQYILKAQKGKDAYDLFSYGPNKEGSPEEEWIRA